MSLPTPNRSSSLAAHIAKLKEAEANKPADAKVDDLLLFWGDRYDKSYLPQLKGCVGSATVFVRIDPISTLNQLVMYCEKKHIGKVITTSTVILSKLLQWDKKRAPSINSYAGSYFSYKGLEIVFIQPLKQLVTVSYGKFIATRLISKLTAPESWYTPTKFEGFTLITPSNEAALYETLSYSFLISIDIETLKENSVIRCLSFTGFMYDSSVPAGIRSVSAELALDSEYALAIMRKWCWELRAPKVFQNGKYDIAYLTRYSAPVYNYLYDTATLMHCMYSELPKDLGFLNAFFIREAMYWKDLSETNDLYEYYRYNSLDTWGTGNCLLAMLIEAPKYAITNYLLEFPLTFPCHLSEMTGIKRDMSKMADARLQQQHIIDKETADLNTILDIKEGESFNVKSPVQMKALLKILGCSHLPSTDEKNLKKARFAHPFNAKIINKVLAVRKARTLISNYLTAGKEFYTPSDSETKTNARFLFSLNPHGTDSARLASKSHHFWCGDNIQKIPRGPIIKQTFCADEGFMLCEVDLEQAESRDTAYISGDAQLIENVEYSPDFHKSNASCFFGVPFEEVTKELRTLGKPVNHGANYNMGAYVLIDTMGEDMIVRAKQLLNLPRAWGYVRVAEYLLDQFHKTYPGIRSVFYRGVVKEIMTTHLLSSQAVHWSHTVDKAKVPDMVEVANSSWETEFNKQGGAWTRYCFDNPEKSKPALNSYISHPPQSLNAQTLNKAYLAVFNTIAMNPEYAPNIKLMAQIHDSIFFQYRIGHDYLCDKVVAAMEIPVTVKAYDGQIRTFVVPAGAKRGQHLKGSNKGMAKYWSETE